MTIQMDTVYQGMVEIYQSQIEYALENEKEVIKISFESFNIGMRSLKIIGNRITAGEKWDNAIADGVIQDYGTKKHRNGILIIDELLRVSGQSEKYKNKYIFQTGVRA